MYLSRLVLLHALNKLLKQSFLFFRSGILVKNTYKLKSFCLKSIKLSLFLSHQDIFTVVYNHPAVEV